MRLKYTVLFQSQRLRAGCWFLLSIKHVKEIFSVIRTLNFVLEKNGTWVLCIVSMWYTFSYIFSQSAIIVLVEKIFLEK